MLRLASASTPASKRRSPLLIAASMSIAPTTRSSEALIGSSTTRIRRRARGSVSPAAIRARQSAHSASRSEGSQPKWQPSTTSCSGSSRARARTAVDLPVPFSPRISTPPIVGTMAFRIRASFIDSWPTMAVKGYECRSRVRLTEPSLGLGWYESLHQLLLLEELLRGHADTLPAVVVVLQVGHDLPPVAVRAHREPELEALRHPVLAVAHYRQRMPVPPGCRRADADHGVDDGVRRRGGRGSAPSLDHGRAPLLDRLHELALEPAVVLDDVLDRQPGDARVVGVRVLSGRVVAPYRHVRDGRNRDLGLVRELGTGSILVEPGHGEPALGSDLGRVHARDVAVRVAGIA